MSNIDVILILGQGLNTDDSVPEHVRHEIIYATQLCKEKNIPAIIFSGNYWGLRQHSIAQISEAQTMKQFAETLPTSNLQFILEDKSLDTISNMIFSKVLIDEHNWHNILVLSATPHLFRVEAIAKRVFGSRYIIQYHGHQPITTKIQYRYYKHYAWIASLYAAWVLRHTWPDDNTKMVAWIKQHHFLYNNGILKKIALKFSLFLK